MRKDNIIDVVQYIDGTSEEEPVFDDLTQPTKLEYALAAIESVVTIAIGMGAMFLFAIILMVILQ